MTFIKKSISDNKIDVLGELYKCSKCGLNIVVYGSQPKTCPDCKTEMTKIEKIKKTEKE